MFFNKIANRAKTKKHKQRMCPSVTTKLPKTKQRQVALLHRGGTLELHTYKKVIRYFKRWIKKKKYKIKFKFQPNYIFSNKNKNARMGKGKGKYKRLLVKLRKYEPFILCEGISRLRLQKHITRLRLICHNQITLRATTTTTLTCSFTAKRSAL